MEKRNGKGNAGFTLVEVLVAISVLGIVTAALGGSLVMAHRINGRSEQIIDARLAVSSAVETLMAEGIDGSKIENGMYNPMDGGDPVLPDGVTVTVLNAPDHTDPTDCYQVTVECQGVSVTTFIRSSAIDATEATTDPSAETTDEPNASDIPDPD